MDIIVRKEIKKDSAAISEVNSLAFKRKNEGLLIEKLRMTKEFNPKLSLVAIYKKRIIGHLLLYPIKMIVGKKRQTILALAPMCVHPDYQRKGIGTKLVRRGIKRANDLGYKSIIVIGHSDYYPRFGFKEACRYGITGPFKVPSNVFLALELSKGVLKDIDGIVEYPKPFYETL